MGAPEHVSTIMGAMCRPCPYCNANPMQPCRTMDGTSRPLRYTHAERNR